MKAPLWITVRGFVAWHIWRVTPGSGHGLFRPIWWGLLPYIADWVHRDRPYLPSSTHPQEKTP